MPELQPDRRGDGKAPLLQVVGENFTLAQPTARTADGPVVVPAADEVQPFIKARPPLTYRAASAVARATGDRQPSVQECLDYSLNGDWTTAGDSAVRRQ